MDTALVRDWMTLTPYTTSSFTMLIDAYQIMKNYEIRRLPVLDETDRLVGIVTLSDIRSVVTACVLDTKSTRRVLEETQVSQVMTLNPVTIQPDAPLFAAAQLMFENKFGGLPVVMQGRLVGIISESDLFRFVMSVSMTETPRETV